MPSDKEIETTAAVIDRFLALQPNGADTAENIQRWWAELPVTKSTSDAVKDALNFLERQGMVEKASMEGGGLIYQRVRA